MTCAHIETVLHKLSSQELVQLFLNTEASKLFAMSSVTKDLLGYLKKLEADIVVLKNLKKKKFFQQIMDNECFGGGRHTHLNWWHNF